MEIQEKRKLAHEWVLKVIGANIRAVDADDLTKRAWEYADAMEVQELKRVNQDPMWNRAPKWAKFRVMNRDGDWFYCDKKPKAGEKDWDMSEVAHTPAPWVAFFGDWSKSLHERA